MDNFGQQNKPDPYGPIKKFVDRHYKHFNAATLKNAAEALRIHLNKGGKLLLSIAGAMSTAEIGISLAEMIRQGKIHAISCTGANLEEDLFNLVAHNHYRLVPNYRDLTPLDELELLKNKFNRVTDTCIPEEEAVRKIENHLIDLWKIAAKEKKSYFSYEYIYQLIKSSILTKYYEIAPKDSWVLAAYEKNIPIFVPGWEDSTLGNVCVAFCRKNGIPFSIVKSGLDTMNFLIDWYMQNSKDSSIGFFQIGGGIAGDFAICVVPLIKQDLKEKCPHWGYFCQISDSVTSYGSYSGAVPNEKITWDKLGVDTPRFIIESDATIVAPLIFTYVLSEFL